MKIDLNPQTHIHFVGIGGSGLSAIAKVLLERGHIVSGSDKEENDRSEELREIGATIYIGHRPEQIDGANFLLVSSAIRESNPEIVEARLRGIPVLKRSDFLATLMGNTIGIAVAGTHGRKRLDRADLAGAIRRRRTHHRRTGCAGRRNETDRCPTTADGHGHRPHRTHAG